MIRIVCEECGKAYNYEVDDFCPKCGAYNQPPKAGTPARRSDGVNESNHAGSFVHQEVHKERQMRMAAGLDKGRSAAAARRKTAAERRVSTPPVTFPRQGQRQRGKSSGSAVSAIVLIVWIIFMANILNFCSA